MHLSASQLSRHKVTFLVWSGGPQLLILSVAYYGDIFCSLAGGYDSISSLRGVAEFVITPVLLCPQNVRFLVTLASRVWSTEFRVTPVFGLLVSPRV